MHEILIYFFTLCLPNVLVTKEPTVRVFWLFHAPGSTRGDLGKTDTFVWLFFIYPSLGRVSCVEWGELCSVAISRDQELLEGPYKSVGVDVITILY